MVFLCFFQNKEQRPFSLKNKQKSDLKKQVGCFFKKSVFLSTLIIFQSFFAIFP